MNVKIKRTEYFLRLLFPVRCICCDTILPIDTSKEVCTNCQESIEVLKEKEYENLPDCNVSKLFTAFSYEGGIREAIHRLKFNDNPHIASVLIDLSYPLLKEYLYSLKPCDSQNSFQSSKTSTEQSQASKPNYDIVIPAPLHRARKRERGYNQSELLASCLAVRFKIPMLKKVLIKTVNTAPQSTLGRRERLKNLSGAFCVNNPNLIEGCKVLLVDDITTTGSTLENCAEVLLNAGAAHVDAYVIAMRRRL